MSIEKPQKKCKHATSILMTTSFGNQANRHTSAPAMVGARASTGCEFINSLGRTVNTKEIDKSLP